MRPHFVNSALWLIFALILLASSVNHVSAQTGQLATAKTDLDNALASVQVAEQLGASNADLLPLVDQLNLALDYETNATLIAQTDPTMSDTLAGRSIAISTQVSQNAIRLGKDAQAASLYRQTASYSIALVLALIASVLVFDLDRLRQRLLQRRAKKIASTNEG